VGFDGDAGGFLTSGGSLANWSAMTIARDLRMPNNFRRGVVYTSNQAHHSVDKAAILAGLDRTNIRRVPVDADFRVQVDVLEEWIDQDRQAGKLPLAIVGNAGTTNTGAVDHLELLADLAKRTDTWLHVDAAYGGFFLLTERGKSALRGIEKADSITLDPHKGLFLPYGTGCLLVRNRSPLRQVFSLRGEYMMTETEGQDFVDFCDVSPELTRDFRGLRVWLPFQMHGAAAFRECLDEKLDLARHTQAELQAIPGVEIVSKSPLSIVAFRLRQPTWTEMETNEKNQSFLRLINGSGRVWLTGTILNEHFVLRICILSFRTHRDRIDECLAIIRHAAAQMIGNP
jgi:aromatic-L-amino-acid/L-tryptophan decarboxylase